MMWIYLCINLWISLTVLSVHLRKLDINQQSMTYVRLVSESHSHLAAQGSRGLAMAGPP
jgi:hypothetical protein